MTSKASTATTITTAARAAATWVWRDASTEGLVASAITAGGPPPRGCF
jgi:hypothetical protein